MNVKLKVEWSPEEIKAFRVQLGLNQSDFVDMLGSGRQQLVSMWEAGTLPHKSNRILLGQLYERCGKPRLKVK